MKLSLHWLKDYVTSGLAKDALAHKLTMAGLEIEGSERVNGKDVFEIEVTPNRSDCLSVIGLAREVSAILNKPLKYPTIKAIKPTKTKIPILIADTKACPQYSGTLIKNVSIKPADSFIHERIAAVDMRPVNNVVDITNFCLMELGQPLHAFDYDKLAGGKITVRFARQGEKIITIDGVERVLDPSILVIADDKRPVAIAGIMGGQGTEVTGSTKNILLESARFDPILIRRAGRKLGLSSDSAYRFERGIDPQLINLGAHRATALIIEHAGGQIAAKTEAGTKRQEKINNLRISVDDINALLGAAIAPGKIVTILKRLGFKVSATSQKTLKVAVPSFRTDIKGSIDIVEEVARVTGYDQLPSTVPTIRNTQMAHSEQRARFLKIKEALVAQGYNEVVTYSTTNQRSLEQANVMDRPGVFIVNPLTQEQEMMRPSALPALLNAAAFNMNRGQKNLKWFECGKIYTPEGERYTLSLLATGQHKNDWRAVAQEDTNYYDVKGALEYVLSAIGTPIDGIKSVRIKHLAAGAAAFYVSKRQVGFLGALSLDVLQRWGIKQKPVLFAEIDLEHVLTQSTKTKIFEPAPEYPAVSRDISLALDKSTPYQDVKDLVNACAPAFLSDILFKEQYLGEKIPAGQRGITFSLVYQSRERTLREDEVDAANDKITQALISKLGATRR